MQGESLWKSNVPALPREMQHQQTQQQHPTNALFPETPGHQQIPADPPMNIAAKRFISGETQRPLKSHRCHGGAYDLCQIQVQPLELRKGWEGSLRHITKRTNTEKGAGATLCPGEIWVCLAAEMLLVI